MNVSYRTRPSRPRASDGPSRRTGRWVGRDLAAVRLHPLKSGRRHLRKLDEHGLVQLGEGALVGEAEELQEAEWTAVEGGERRSEPGEPSVSEVMCELGGGHAQRPAGRAHPGEQFGERLVGN